ncbi:hypothetical protein F0P96_09840 [Hymenobacter busanensis]|uniref:Uncharacterized protein n=3 Tax=Hymenobacter busanensis TaxID=2607656 RepID=A0A7L5A375_9BACT|nr:hypothetical protein F0P96_09840 [Hymenobacter busanensis]QHJ09693.1 hypothetical protein GUY19_12480 [Hymenobacter busanensis]
MVRRWSMRALLVAAGLSAGAVFKPAPRAPLVLHAAPLPFAPTEFYISQVLDERADRAAVAYLLPLSAPAAPQPVDLQGGGAAAIREFVRQSLPRNTALRPVTVRLQECVVRETAAAGAPGRVEGRATVAMAFEWQRNGRTIPLTTYRGTARYLRPAAQPGGTEPALQQALADALRHLNAWVNREVNGNAKLATALRVHTTDDVHPADDTLFYSSAQPLSLDDFRAEPRLTGRYAATVFPSFAYSARAQTVSGVLHLHLQMQVFVVRSASWVRPTARTAYTLAHEQRHFDVVKLVAERFKRKVQPDSLTLDNYDARMQYQYLQSWWEMNRLQEQYDAETGGGTNEAAQQRWNQRLDAELRAFGVK